MAVSVDYVAWFTRKYSRYENLVYMETPKTTSKIKENNISNMCLKTYSTI